MLADDIEDPAETSPEELLRRYERALADAVEAVGQERVREATGLADGTVAAVAAGDSADLALEDAAAILALDDGGDAETTLAEVRNHLLLEMSSAMLDVDRIAVEVGDDLDAKEIQAMMEGRHPMTLAEYATIYHYVATEADW